MNKDEIQNEIRELVEKVAGDLKGISVTEDKPGEIWISVEIDQPHLFTSRDGEGLHAINHLAHRIMESKRPNGSDDEGRNAGILIDINGFQKKRVENIRAIAHMMSERARYFKSNIEVDPMSAFERRIVHEFLSDAPDIETESIGTGRSRRVVIKYIGGLT